MIPKQQLTSLIGIEPHMVHLTNAATSEWRAYATWLEWNGRLLNLDHKWGAKEAELVGAVAADSWLST